MKKNILKTAVICITSLLFTQKSCIDDNTTPYGAFYKWGIENKLTSTTIESQYYNASNEARFDSEKFNAEIVSSTANDITVAWSYEVDNYTFRFSNKEFPNILNDFKYALYYENITLSNTVHGDLQVAVGNKIVVNSTSTIPLVNGQVVDVGFAIYQPDIKKYTHTRLKTGFERAIDGSIQVTGNH